MLQNDRAGSNSRCMYVENNMFSYRWYNLYQVVFRLLSPAPSHLPDSQCFAFFSFIFNELFQVQAREEQIKGTFSTGRKEVTIEPINQSNENRSSNLNALRRTFVFFS